MANECNDTLSDEIITLRCSICAKQNKTKDAEMYCTVCQEYLCIPCSDMHKMFAMFETHTVLSKAEFNTSVYKGSLPHIPTERCAKHKIKVLDVYCENHDAVLCTSCIIEHRSCADIHSIPSDIDRLFNHSTFLKIRDKLQTLTKQVEDIQRDKQFKLKELPEIKDRAVQAVKTLRKEINSLLYDLEASSVEEIELQYQIIKAELTTQIVRSGTIANSLEELSKTLKRSEGNTAQEFVTSKSVEKDINKAEKAIEKILTVDEKSISFEENPEIRLFFESMKSLGTIYLHKQCSSLYKIKRMRQSNVSLQKNDNRRCRISGMCLDDNGFLLLVDYENNKFKRFDLSAENIKDFINLQKPRAVCLVSNTEAVVSLCGSLVGDSYIQFLTLGDQMTAARGFRLVHPSTGIVYHNKNLYISDGKDKVYTYDLAGSELYRTTTGNSTLFNQLSSQSDVINTGMCIRLNRVYVMNEDKGVIEIGTLRRCVSTFCDLGNIRVSAVSTDGRNIFIAGYNKKHVVQIRHDGRIVGEFGDVQHALSMCFDSRYNTLIVSEDRQNEIKIFELE